jgi:hypothetical protein
MQTYMAISSTRLLSGYRSESAKHMSVSAMNMVTYMSMKIRRANMNRRGPAARPIPARIATS